MGKVLHIVGSMDPSGGGVAEAVKLMFMGMRENNIEGDIITLDAPNSSYLANNDLPIFCFGPAFTSWKYSKKLDVWLKNNINNYSIVFVHGLWQYQTYATFKTLANVSSHTRIFVYPHGMLDPYFQKAKGRRLKAIRNFLFWHLFEKKLINNCTGLIFTSQEEQDLAKQTFKDYHPPKIFTASLGIIKPKFVEFPNYSNNKYWLYLGRIHPKKGIDILIDVYLLLKKSNNLPKLIIAGPGWDDEFGLQLKQKLDGNDEIEIQGMTTGDAKWNLINNSELFILPSHQENFGISVVEALACGVVPLITNKVNIYREILDADAGIIADDNLNSIKAQLEKWVLFDSYKRANMSENAKILFQKSFSLKNSTNHLLKIIDFYGS